MKRPFTDADATHRKRVRPAGQSYRAQKGSDTKDTADVYVHRSVTPAEPSMAEKYNLHKEQPNGVVLITRFRSARVAGINRWEVFGDDDSNLRFELFSPRKFKDAEAVSFLGKALTANGYGNASLAANGPTLRDVVVVNARARFDFKNVSQNTTTLEMYVCSMKRDQTYAGTYPQDDLALALDMYDGNSSGTTGTSLYTDPLSVKTWTDMWNVRKVKIVMEPGETASHTMQGPSKYVMDARRHVILGTTAISDPPTWMNPEMQGNGFYVFFRMLNQISFLATTDAGTAANAKMGGRRIYPGHPLNTLPGTDGSLQGGVIIKLQEYYCIKCPMDVDSNDTRNVLVDLVNVTGTPVNVQIDSDQPLTTVSAPL